MRIWSAIVSEPLDVSNVTSRVESPETGAALVFLGLVRNHHDGKEVSGMTYDCFIPLAERTLYSIAEEACVRFDQDASVAVVHRIGALKVGEASLLIAVGSSHRAESYSISRCILEEIKKRLPVWKCEHYVNAQSQWLKGTALPRAPLVKVVLAGGRSSRMGRSKNELPWRGGSLLSHMQATLSQVCAGRGTLWVSARETDAVAVKTVMDQLEFQGKGPLTGVYSVLNAYAKEHTSAGIILFVPVDMPLLQPQDLEVLVSELEQNPEVQGAYFSPSVLPCAIRYAPPLSSIFCNEVGSIQELHRRLGSRALTPDLERHERLLNTNTPEDWQKVQVKE